MPADRAPRATFPEHQKNLTITAGPDEDGLRLDKLLSF